MQENRCFDHGGKLSSEVMGHTSTLRLSETRFGVEVPTLTAWRRSVTGDMTGSLSFGSPPDRSVPALPLALLPPAVVRRGIHSQRADGHHEVGLALPAAHAQRYARAGTGPATALPIVMDSSPSTRVATFVHTREARPGRRSPTNANRGAR